MRNAKATQPKPQRPSACTTPSKAVSAPQTAKSAAKRPVVTARIPEIASLAGGRLWRMSGRHAVAYVTNAQLAGELLATDVRNLLKKAMAVYYDSKGRPIAWQIRFDAARWEEVVRRLQ